MYLEHFGLTELPFTITPHTEFFFAGANRGATLEALLYAVTNGEGIVKVSGEVGSGKTMLCRVLMERLPDNVETIYLAIPSLSRDEILEAICTDLGVKTSNTSPNALLKSLQDHLLSLHEQGKRVVALIDEAHAMPLESLEELRLLSNLETNRSKLLQIVLFGQPELDENLSKQQLRQLRERITHSFRLSPLSFEEVQAYLRHRLKAAGYKGAEVFNKACVKLIAQISKGLTRRINIIADKSLLAAFSQNTHTVSTAHVKAAIRDSEFAMIKPTRLRTRWAIGTAIGIGLGLGVAGTLAAIKINDSVFFNSQTKSQTPTQQLPKVSVAPVDEPIHKQLVIHSQKTQIPIQKSLNDYLNESAQWLAQEQNNRWVIQLMLANSTETNTVLNFVRESEKLLDHGKIHVYPLQINHTDKFSVVYGSFDNRSLAFSAFETLPDKIKQFKPYLRSVPVLRAEAKPTDTLARAE